LEVEDTVKETIQKAGKGGGYIISSSNSIHPGCKPENYIAMVKAAHRYGVYNVDDYKMYYKPSWHRV
jgi:uroporphyrinogen decarboxylase